MFEVRSAKSLLLCVILLFSSIPFSTVGAESVEICCDSSPVDLYLIGPAASGEMSPFEASLSEESEEYTISDAIAQQQEIASWEISPAWTGTYPTSTWEFSIDYSVENAGGVQINASVEVLIGGESYLGSTDQSNSFLPSGEGTLRINVNVETGSISSSSRISVTLSAQTVVFSVPGTDAGLTFIWGGVGDESSVNADIPVVDLVLEEPVTEGMDVYLSMIVASPFGQMTAAHATSLGISVNNGAVSGDPIVTSSGDYVRLTWTWTSTSSGEQEITVTGSIQIQSGTPTLSGSTTFTIETADNGDGGGSGFYPTEEPLRSDGAGSKLIASMDMNLDTTDGFLTLERKIRLNIDGEMAYWMRWGMDNIGSDDASLSQPLRIFKSGTVSDDDRRNRMIDDVERNEFESQMVNLAVTYMNDGMAIELEELIGNDVQDLERISFSVDLQGKKNVIPHPLSLTITTLEILEENKETVLLRNFIIVQPTPIWSSMDMSISIDTGLMSSLTGANIKGEDSIDVTHRRTPIGETIEISVNDLKPSATFSFNAYPTSNYLNAPLSLYIITLGIIIGGLLLSLNITKNKRRGALYIELILIPVVLLGLYLGYNPFTVGTIAGITVTMWFITAIASPKKKGLAVETQTQIYPTIECPACGTPNSITTEERPFRLPCQGCGRVLKIVE